MRSLFARLLLLICGVASGAALVALVLIDRSLSRDLETAAVERLSQAAKASERLLESHLEAMADRYRAISGTPQFRATLEVDDAPTLEHYASSLVMQQEAEGIAFLDVAGRVVAAAGRIRAEARAHGVAKRDVISHAGSPVAVVNVPLGPAGRLLAIEAIDDATLDSWSELVGAHVSFDSRLAPAGEGLMRTVREVGDLELRVQSSLRAERAAMAHARWNLAAVGALALAAAFGASLVASRGLVRPIRELRAAAEQVGAGDLTVGIESVRRDEIGDVARAFAVMGQGLRATVHRVVNAADRVDSTAGRIAQWTRQLVEVAQAQATGHREAGAALEGIDAQVVRIADTVELSGQTLDGAVDGSSASFRELSRSGESLKKNVALLGDQTLQIATVIEKVIGASVEVADHMDSLLPAVEETSVSTQRMERTSREVHSHVEETARLSGRVVEAAEAGRQSVRRTAAGMEAIRDATGEAQTTIVDLAQRGTEIGGILTVIDDVTGETDLLALNAAIIAAQAGERGKAFAVVAEQMKALANRVASSTREIQGLVSAVQEGCADAVAAIERGSSRVEDGVTLAREAESSLEDITGAASESGERMRESAAATSDQIEAVAHVVQQMEHVRARTKEIRGSARDQEQGHDSLRASSDTLAEVASGVQETVDAQARDAERIGQSIETVQRTVREIASGLHEQLEACRQVARVVEGSGTHIEANEESAAGLAESARTLASEAEALREAVRRFRL